MQRTWSIATSHKEMSDTIGGDLALAFGGNFHLGRRESSTVAQVPDQHMGV